MHTLFFQFPKAHFEDEFNPFLSILTFGPLGEGF